MYMLHMYSNRDKNGGKKWAIPLQQSISPKSEKSRTKWREQEKTQKERECHQRKGVVENCAFPTMHF